MPKAVIADWDRFHAYLAAQPLCMWAEQKQHEIATGVLTGLGGPARPAPKKDDNADLVAALSSMA